MTSAASIITNQGERIKYLEIQRANSHPHLRGSISNVEFQQKPSSSRLTISLDYRTELCLGRNDWFPPEEKQEIVCLFDEKNFSFIGLEACPMFIIKDKEGDEYLFFKPEDNYVAKEPGFRE